MCDRACGQLIYRGDQLPRSYYGHLFACEPSQNLVHRCRITRHGPRYEARRDPSETRSEFLTSTDQWFRPINLATGPDGAIYIVDMYREIIEDYSAIPRYLQQQYGLIEGRDRGRIWRIVGRPDASQRPGRAGSARAGSARAGSARAGSARAGSARAGSANPPYPQAMAPQLLVERLSHPNAWWRQTAQRLLVERRQEARTVQGRLAALARDGERPQAEQAAPPVERTILRKDTDAIKAIEQSLMPDDLKRQVPPREMADLIAYLRQALGPVPPSQRVLFDEDPGFASLLNEGSGTASIVRGDAAEGVLALRVTPPQRFARNIAGWEFRIREHPAPGEFRYLRFAWKTGGSGIMIELAADGAWPPAEQPVRRYFSGKNGTPWAALRVSPQVPRQWAGVTRDLWNDLGDFTLTGIAPTALGGDAYFDRLELLRSLDAP